MKTPRHLRNSLHAAIVFLLILPWHSLAMGTPAYDVLVAKDGTGNFTTIQEAVTACRDFAEQDCTILVKNGLYREKLVILPGNGG